ncbi:MAG: sugar kinase [Pseudolabrys sp.]|nr:sugar kinase [Pseudolabrys sp.]MDP2294558.1 sugar kinase [Pseudolabrys sp.]
MIETTKRAICVGEATIELARGGDGRFALASSGDTFNTAIYLARAGQPTAFATALGDDPYSDAIVSLAAAESIGTDLIARVAGRLPALALADAGLTGARRTHGWGENQPARELFELPDWSLTAAALTTARLVYFSGITLSLYSNVGLGRFLAALELARAAGAKVAFDGNFRPHGWRGDLSRARTVFAEALKRVDIALPAYDDEAVLWGDPSPESTVERLQAFGVAEIVVKNGPNGALVANAGARDMVPVPEIVTPVDATAAGDGFNAGYLAARLAGHGAMEAAAAAHRLAGQVIRHRGAIVPRAGAAMH